MSEPESESVYVCIGLCQADPQTGVCLGCGRPPPAEERAGPLLAEAPPEITLPQAGARPA